MRKKRVVVTGMGLVSCFGMDVELFYDKLLAGESGVGLLDVFPCDEYPTRIAAPVRNFDTEGYLDKKQARRVDPFIAYSVVAGKKALEMARLPATALDSLDKARCGVLLGTGMGGMQTFYDGVYTLRDKGFRRLTPFFVPYIITNMGGAMLAMECGFLGPNYSLSTACATANYSIACAANHIQRGDADLMVCGGVESPLNPIGLAGFVAIKALSERNAEPTKASRPWDLNRDGFVIGEGAGVLILESLEHAQARGVPILAEYRGGAMNCDAYHVTDTRPDGLGQAACIRLALQDGGIAPEEINYVNAHATSTPVGDVPEILATHQVFGSHAKNIKMNATKSMTGHSLGAAGGLEAIAVIMAIRRGMIHPTINLDNPVPELGVIDPVAYKAQKFQVNIGISNSFGFGGHNSVVAFSGFH